MRALNILLVSALSILTTAADAGLKHTAGVTVNYGGKYANGALTAARATGNTIEYIDCQMTITSGSKLVTCNAKDSAGNLATCSGSFDKHFQSVKMIGPSSWIQFIWDNNANCVQITVRNGSPFIP